MVKLLCVTQATKLVLFILYTFLIQNTFSIVFVLKYSMFASISVPYFKSNLLLMVKELLSLEWNNSLKGSVK